MRLLLIVFVWMTVGNSLVAGAPTTAPTAVPTAKPTAKPTAMPTGGSGSNVPEGYLHTISYAGSTCSALEGLPPVYGTIQELGMCQQKLNTTTGVAISSYINSFVSTGALSYKIVTTSFTDVSCTLGGTQTAATHGQLETCMAPGGASGKLYSYFTTYSKGTVVPPIVTNGVAITSYSSMSACEEQPYAGPISSIVTYASNTCIQTAFGSALFTCTGTSSYTESLFSDVNCTVVTSTATTAFNATCAVNSGVSNSERLVSIASCVDPSRFEATGYTTTTFFDDLTCSGPPSASLFQVTHSYGLCQQYLNTSVDSTITGSYMSIFVNPGASGASNSYQSITYSYTDSSCTQNQKQVVVIPGLLDTCQVEQSSLFSRSYMTTYSSGSSVPALDVLGVVQTFYSHNTYCVQGSNPSTLYAYQSGVCIPSYSGSLMYTCTGSGYTGSFFSDSKCQNLTSTSGGFIPTGCEDMTGTIDNTEQLLFDVQCMVPELATGYLKSNYFSDPDCGITNLAAVDEPIYHTIHSYGICMQSFNGTSTQVTGSFSTAFEFVDDKMINYKSITTLFTDATCTLGAKQFDAIPGSIDTCVTLSPTLSMLSRFSNSSVVPNVEINGFKQSYYSSMTACTSTYASPITDVYVYKPNTCISTYAGSMIFTCQHRVSYTATYFSDHECSMITSEQSGLLPILCDDNVGQVDNTQQLVESSVCMVLEQPTAYIKSTYYADETCGVGEKNGTAAASPLFQSIHSFGLCFEYIDQTGAVLGSFMTHFHYIGADQYESITTNYDDGACSVNPVQALVVPGVLDTCIKSTGTAGGSSVTKYYGSITVPPTDISGLQLTFFSSLTFCRLQTPVSDMYSFATGTCIATPTGGSEIYTCSATEYSKAVYSDGACTKLVDTTSYPITPTVDSCVDYYGQVDNNQQLVSFAVCNVPPSSTSPTAAPNAASPSSASSSGGANLSAGGLAGLIIGMIIAGALIAAAIFYFIVMPRVSGSGGNAGSRNTEFANRSSSTRDTIPPASANANNNTTMNPVFASTAF